MPTPRRNRPTVDPAAEQPPADPAVSTDPPAVADLPAAPLVEPDLVDEPAAEQPPAPADPPPPADAPPATDPVPDGQSDRADEAETARSVAEQSYIRNERRRRPAPRTANQEN
jgi:hypothetical protein